MAQIFTPANLYYEVDLDEFKKRRKELKLTQAQVSAFLGYQPNYISRVETGKIPFISADVCKKLRELLRIDDVCVKAS